MKAYEYELQLRKSAIPKVLKEEEQTWNSYKKTLIEEDNKIKLLWNSHVPGSYAPERVIIGAIQSVESMGRKVDKAEKLMYMGIKALEEDCMYDLYKITSRILYELNNAAIDEKSSYWKYKQYNTWEEYESSVSFLNTEYYDVTSKDFEQKILAGWIGQICGGALGTAIEGYTTENIKNAFGEINDYVRKPNTFNDDITYELAFLKAFNEKGYEISSIDIAEEWVALIPDGWSAEEVALKNIKSGIYPPHSGTVNNPYREWIGAQMRGAVCGMVSPGNPREAAKLAWKDGVVSHANNGVIGEVFNALMTSLAFVNRDIRDIIKEAINMLPNDSEYYSVVKYALDLCQNNYKWEECWALCEDKYKNYNWIHAYPNAAAEVIALWFGYGDFNKTMNIISMEGQDVDCNAAQIATIVCISSDEKGMDYEKWIKPIGDDLYTYVRGMEELKISTLANWTSNMVREANIVK